MLESAVRLAVLDNTLGQGRADASNRFKFARIGLVNADQDRRCRLFSGWRSLNPRKGHRQGTPQEGDRHQGKPPSIVSLHRTHLLPFSLLSRTGGRVPKIYNNVNMIFILNNTPFFPFFTVSAFICCARSCDSYNDPTMLKVGPRIREIRKGKKVTLIELSKQTGIAQATLSRIETGRMIGTVESHQKIADALGLTLAALYAPLDRRYEEVAVGKKETARKLVHQGRGCQIELLTQEVTKKKITPLYVTLSGSSKTALEENERGVEKFIWVQECTSFS